MMKLTSTPVLAERVTALVSAAVAIALLGIAVSAQTGRHATTDPIEQLASETRLQLRLGLGHDQTLLNARAAVLDQALSAYRASEQTSEDRRLLNGWLREAMVRSMPGAVRPLLPLPVFGATPVNDPETAGRETSPSEPSHPVADDLEEQSVTLQEQIVDTPAVVNQPPEPPGDFPYVDAAPDVAPTPREILRTRPSGPSVDEVTPTPTLADEPTTELPSAPVKPAAESILIPAADPPTAPTPATAVVATTGPISTSAVPSQSGPRRPSAESKEGPIAVNMSRLSLELASYHAMLDEVRNACSHREVTLADLQEAVDQLERLTTQWDFIRLYHDLLTPAQQGRLGPPADWADTLPAVEQALDRVARQTDGDFLRPLESDRQEVISELRRQVEKLSRQASR